MKILNLRFKNINSLSGENFIDFTEPVFTNDGLFAITGKTGAGKSSILDAISLAFYGKTPRVEITGNENAVMTRGEKDCYAEIVFEVAGKKWKSSWKQERARTGTLKSVSRIIADFEDKIVADQVRTCDIKIVEILGLKFEQFTKVIMLAQGSFAAFLQAKNDEKGELLEQITGTEIYAEISKKVFDRNKTEKEKLDLILVQLDAIKVLSEEEIKNLTEEIEIFGNDKKQLDIEIQKLEKAKKWLSDLEILQEQIKEANQKLPDLEQKTIIANLAFEKSEIALQTAKEEYKTLEPIFKKVRELDTKISEKEKLLQPILKSISELENNQKEFSKTLETQKKDLEKHQNSLTEKQKWASENKKYEELVSNFTAIEKENELLVGYSNELKKLNSEITTLKKDLDVKTANSKKATENFNEKEKTFSAKTIELATKKIEFETILGGKELSELQFEKEIITNFGTKIKELIDVEKSVLSNQKEIEDFENKIQQFEKLTVELSKKIETDKNLISNFESKIILLEENIHLTKTIQSLDEHRKHLKDGDDCPLCGSKEHPFAIGNIPEIGNKEKELALLKKQKLETTNAIQENEKSLAKTTSDKENAVENKAKQEKLLQDNSLKNKQLIAEIKTLKPEFLIPEGKNKIELLNNILVSKRTELKDVTELIKQAISCEKQLINLRDNEIPLLQKETQIAEKQKTDAENNQKIAELHFVEKQKLATISQEKYTIENENFTSKLKKYEVETIEELKKCLDSWNENKNQTEVLTNQILALNGTIALNNKELDNQKKSFEEKDNERNSIQTDKQKLADERREIFETKLVEEEEIRLKKLLEQTETAKTKAEKEKNDSYTEFEKNKAIVTEKEKEFLKIQEQKITEKSIEEIQEEYNSMKKMADDFSQKIGANNQALHSNNENLKTSGTKLKEKEKQQVICNKWKNLNELIGSGDGKKYRNFAQVLTFEHLITLSNRQLHKMSDRYILKRTGDNSNPFELSVIDNYQNSEERTAQNLSGGEKFIVSLSLALGLANMASKNMSIDTMFIDEGFGTLDSDYLDVALNALSNLQSEGKIIGVISHLSELKERIATHIEVIPSGNGHSKILIKG